MEPFFCVKSSWRYLCRFRPFPKRASLKFIHITLCIVFTFLIHTVQGQILNIERLRLEKDTTKSFLAKGILSLNANNRSASEAEPVQVFGINTALNALYQPGQHAYIFVGQTDYLNINDNDVLNFGFAHFRINFLRDRKISYEVFSQYSYDAFRGLDPRLLGGGSIRFQLIKTEKADLEISTGAFYEHETWRNPITEEFVEVGLWKSSNYVKYQKTLNDIIDLNTIIYYQVGYDGGAEVFRHRVSGSVNINTQFTRILSLNTTFDMSYEDKPIVPVTKFIFSLKTGLAVNF